MQPLIYDVAVSIDGFIAGPGGDVARFAHDGPVVDDYAARLSTYGTAIMGRGTYEFGYRYGMSPGQNPYPAMTTYVVSTRLDLPDGSDVTLIGEDLPGRVAALKRGATAPLYLVGGGELAAAMLGAGLVDEMVLKRAPIVLGGGTPLVSGPAGETVLRCRSTRPYDCGYVLQRFDVEVH